MTVQSKIKNICAEEILDSRGNPSVCATVILEDGSGACASVPSGASTGRWEAFELRDGDEERYGGKGVLCACENINCVIAPALIGSRLCQHSIDMKLRQLDGTSDKSNLGANAVLAVSLAAARAGAQAARQPLYRHLGGINAVKMPVPMMNILNGGAHASNNADIQEFMIMPVGFDSFAEALRAGSEIYHALGKILSRDGRSTAVGDEGGFAPDADGEEELLDYIIAATEAAGYSTNEVKIALDAAASEWYTDGTYRLPKSGRCFSSEELVGYWSRLCERYPIASVEDGLGEDDASGWQALTKALGERCTLVGDDLFTTNTVLVANGIEGRLANAVLVKPNQTGTLTEALDVICVASDAGWRSIISHRSGETEDTFIADLAVASGAGYIKCGAPCRGERTAKYNRLLRIESQLGIAARYGNVQW